MKVPAAFTNINFHTMPLVTRIASAVASILFLIFLIMGLFLVYSLFSSGYPRLFTIGHTEPLEKFMATGIKTLYDDCVKIQTGVSDARLDLFISTFFNNVGDSFKPADLPDLYIMFMFNEAIKESNANELASLVNFFEAHLVSDYYIPNSTTTIGTFDKLKNHMIIFTDFQAYIAEYTEILKASEGDFVHRFLVFNVNMFLNTYIKDITLAYDLRKSGRINSFVIFKLYMKDYITFVFHETIPSTWESFMSEVRLYADEIQKYVGSDSVREFVESIPWTISGLQENFEVETERREYFGIGDFFKSVIQLFTSLFELVKMIATAVANPIAVFRIIIGVIVGLILYILYVLVMALSFLFVVPAFIYIASFKLLITMIWVALFAIIALVYVVLWLGDICTNGYVFSLLRCENLPSAWYTHPGFAKSNTHSRKLLCCNTCGERYAPTSWMCQRMKPYIPSFCPQQLIYNAFTYKASVKDQAKYDFTPSTHYYSKKKSDRKGLLGEIYDDQVVFHDECQKSMKSYNHIIRDICDFYAANPDTSESDVVMKMCRNAYCSGDELTEPSYCKVAQVSAPNSGEIDVSKRIISIIIMFLLLLVLFGIVYKATSR